MLWNRLFVGCIGSWTELKTENWGLCFLPCPFAGYLAQHSSAPPPLPPIRWNYEVQAHPSDGFVSAALRMQPASAHRLPPARSVRHVVEQRRAAQGAEYFGHRSGAAYENEAGRSQRRRLRDGDFGCAQSSASVCERRLRREFDACRVQRIDHPGNDESG